MRPAIKIRIVTLKNNLMVGTIKVGGKETGFNCDVTGVKFGNPEVVNDEGRQVIISIASRLIT